MLYILFSDLVSNAFLCKKSTASAVPSAYTLLPQTLCCNSKETLVEEGQLRLLKEISGLMTRQRNGPSETEGHERRKI